jgi:arylsulfatase
VLYATGNENSGLTVYVQDDHLVFDYNAFRDHQVVRSAQPLPAGACTAGVRFRRAGGAATATLVVDGVEQGSVDVPLVLGMIAQVGASVGFDDGSAVSESYAAPFPFEGTIDRIDIELVSQSRAQAAEQAAVEQQASDARQ